MVKVRTIKLRNKLGNPVILYGKTLTVKNS